MNKQRHELEATALPKIEVPTLPKPKCFHEALICEATTGPRPLCTGCECGKCDGNEDEIERCGGTLQMLHPPSIVSYEVLYSENPALVGATTKRVRLWYTCKTCKTVTDDTITAEHDCLGLTDEIRFKLSLLDHPVLF